MKQQLRRYRIAHIFEETCCDYCGYPLGLGEWAYEMINGGQDIVCSKRCGQKVEWAEEVATRLSSATPLFDGGH